MSKQIDITRNTSRRITSIRMHRGDDRRVQVQAQVNLRSAFPYDDPPPLPEEVAEAREALRHEQESGLHVFGWVIACAVVCALVVAGYVAWRMQP